MSPLSWNSNLFLKTQMPPPLWSSPYSLLLWVMLSSLVILPLSTYFHPKTAHCIGMMCSEAGFPRDIAVRSLRVRTLSLSLNLVQGCTGNTLSKCFWIYQSVRRGLRVTEGKDFDGQDIWAKLQLLQSCVLWTFINLSRLYLVICWIAGEAIWFLQSL